MNGNTLGDNKYKKEMIDGKIHLMSPATVYHAITVENLNFIFKNYINKKHKECKVFSESLAIYLNKDDKTFVLPDVLIVCDKNKFSKRGYEGAPTLIVEVLSPATVEHDRTTKFKKYEASGVLEYLLVDYNNKLIEQYTLNNGTYMLKKLVALLDEWEIENLPDEKKTGYTSIIKVSAFEDLEINLADIFE